MSKRVVQYKRIENDIMDKIISQQYKMDDFIPTECQLAKEYGVSRLTVRRAMDNLVIKGMLKRTPGLGTSVIYSASINVDTCVKGFTQHMVEQGKEVETSVKSFSITKANKHIASMLGVDIGTDIYSFERIRCADKKVYLFEESYVPVEPYPDLSIQHLKGSKFIYLQNKETVTIHHQRQFVKPLVSDDYLSDILGIPVGTPMLAVESITVANDGRIIDGSINYYNPYNYKLQYIKNNEKSH